MVGDAREEDAYARLMQGETAEMAFLDPPYNVRIAGHAGGRGRTKHREFAIASGEMTSRQYVEFLKGTLGLCARHTIDGGINSSAWTGGTLASCWKPVVQSTTS